MQRADRLLTSLRAIRPFWRGFASGALATLLILALISVVLIVRATSVVVERMDERVRELDSRTRPLLDPPPIEDAYSFVGDSRDNPLEVHLMKWPIEDLDGRSVKWEDFEGRLLFVNYWATWCAPCIAELPSIQELARASRADAQFLLLTDESREDVTRFLNGNSQFASLPIFLVHDGVPAEMWFKGRPTTFLIDCTRRIRLRHTGPANWNTSAFRSYLRQVSAESCGG